MFSFAIYRAAVSISARTRLNDRPSLTAILIHENIFYFCVVSWVLIFNNLMVIVSIYYIWFNIIFKLTSQLTCSKGKTNIPWFGFGSVKLYMHAPCPRNSSCENIYRSPFHAAVGIATCRMLMHLRKFAKHELDGQGNATTKATKVDSSIVFRGYEREDSQGSTTSWENQLASP